MLSLRSAALAVFLCCAAVLLAGPAAGVLSSSSKEGQQWHLLVALKQRNLDKLEHLFWEVSDPDSPSYAQFLTRDQLRELTAPSPANVLSVQSWLSSALGATHTVLKDSGDILEVTMPSLHRLSGGATIRQRFYATAPKSITDLIDDIVVIRSPETSFKRQVQCSESQLTRQTHFRSKPTVQLADPNTQKLAYGMPAHVRGTNNTNSQMVWGPCTYGYLPSDMKLFYSTYNVPASTADIVTEGYQGLPGGDNFGEATLDVSYITALAPGVKTIVSNTNNTPSTEEGQGFGAAMVYFLSDLASRESVPYVLSLSLGSLSWDSVDLMCSKVQETGQFSYKECMEYLQQQRQVAMYTGENQMLRMNVEFQKLGLRGVTVFAAAGDGGSHFSFQPFQGGDIAEILNDISCKYNFPTYPSASPYVVSVGGTMLKDDIKRPVHWPAGGSGFSWRFPRPKYQDEAVTIYLKTMQSSLPPSYSFNSSARAYPDVSAVGENVPMFVQGRKVSTGGTSASTPEIAGIFSIINDYRLNSNLPPLGFVNPRLYKTAKQVPGVLFYDVNEGNSNCSADGSCCDTGFPSASGWDPLSGLGSPLFPGLLAYLSAAP
ncbi:Peptidase S53 domain-containing protein [Balamuthia mandrillaris]